MKHGRFGFVLSTLLVVLALLVSACGKSAADKSASQQSQSQTSASPASTSGQSSQQPAQTEAPKEPLKVGVLLSLSGPAGPVGERELLGTEIAVEEINAEGGILGRKIELIIRDDGGDPTKSLTLAQELVEKEKVAVIIGPTLSSPALAILPYLTEQKILNLGSPAATEATDPTKFPYSFTSSPNNEFMAGTIVSYAADSLKLSKIAVLTESTALGKGGLAALDPMFAAKNITPVAMEEYKTGDIDYTAQLKKVRSAGAEGMVIWAGNSTDLVRLMKNLQSMGWDVPVLSTSNLADAAVIEGVGPAGLTKAYAQSHRPLTFTDNSPLPQLTADFRENVRARLGGPKPLKTSLVLPAAFYDAMYVLKTAAEQAGSVEADKLKPAMESIRDYPGVYATWTFTPEKHAPLGDDDGTMVLSSTCEDAVCARAPGAP